MEHFSIQHCNIPVNGHGSVWKWGYSMFFAQINIFEVNYKNTNVISNNATLHSGLYDVYTVILYII